MTEKCRFVHNPACLAGVGSQMLPMAAPACKQWMENVTAGIPQIRAETRLGE